MSNYWLMRAKQRRQVNRNKKIKTALITGLIILAVVIGAVYLISLNRTYSNHICKDVYKLNVNCER